MIHTQSAVHCMVELVRQNKLDPGTGVSIEADVLGNASDFAGGGALRRGQGRPDQGTGGSQPAISARGGVA